MKVLLAATGDASWSRQLLDETTAIAGADRVGRHVVVTDPAAADIILFIDVHQRPSDWRMDGVRRHPYVDTYQEKALVYDERDRPRDSLPGVYVSLPANRFDVRRHRAIGYMRLPTDTRPARSREPDLLFSFQGRALPGVREEVLRLRHPRAVVEDTAAYDFFGGGRIPTDSARRRYTETLSRSKFVLCPRGAGTASFRLFEALACGRVPVIISNRWVAPPEVEWHACSVRVSEQAVPSITTRLEALEEDWPRMSAAASAVYDEWFAPEVWFHRAVEHCVALRDNGASGLRRQWLSRDFWEHGARHLRARWWARPSS